LHLTTFLLIHFAIRTSIPILARYKSFETLVINIPSKSDSIQYTLYEI